MTTTDHAMGLLDLLRVREAGPDHYVAPPTPPQFRYPTARMFGGQVIAQALLAAEASVPETSPPGARPAASFHCRFLRPGMDNLPVNYRIMRDMDGGSVTHRRITVDQGAGPILTASVMCHQPRDDGPSHQAEMPDAPEPEALAAELAARAAEGRPLSKPVQHFLAKQIVKALPADIDQWDAEAPQDAPARIWFRFGGVLPDDPPLHRAILAYTSDLSILRAIDVRLGLNWFRGDMVQASLDHAIWFHEPFRADEWLLHVTTSDWSGHSRGLARGHVFARDGRLVASTSQECIIRLMR